MQQDHHEVESAEDIKSARAAILASPPEVVVFAWPIAGGADFVKHVRASDGTGHIYIIVLLDRQPPTTIPMLFAAGADDFMRRPIVREELSARVDAPHRIGKWSLARGAEEAAGSDWASCADVRGTRACREMAKIIVDDLEQLPRPSLMSERELLNLIFLPGFLEANANLLGVSGHTPLLTVQERTLTVLVPGDAVGINVVSPFLATSNAAWIDAEPNVGNVVYVVGSGGHPVVVHKVIP